MRGLGSRCKTAGWLLVLAAVLAGTAASPSIAAGGALDAGGAPAATSAHGGKGKHGASGAGAAARASAAPAAVGIPGLPPRLVVLISIDQFRGDYLTRFADLYLPAGSAAKPGGFRYLMERGAYFTDAHHDHYPLFTGPGHSVLLTGAPPYKSGIVGNGWYDRDLGCQRYCVEDDASPLVGAAAPPAAGGAAAAAAAAGVGGVPCALRAAGAGAAAPGAAAGAAAASSGGASSSGAPARMGISPATLRVDTVGDELKMATGGRAKVWGLAFKDRAAVLMAGHLADGALWLDDESGAWISSRFYRPDGTLPPWVAAWNARHPIDAYFEREWTLSVPEAALARLWTPGSRWATDPSALGTGFPHLINGGTPRGSALGKDFYSAFTTTPFGNGYVLETAGELIRRERLGRGEVPDLLAINLSSNDYIGHAFGPDSPEVLDASVRTDRQLAAFFGSLEREVPGGLGAVLLVVTADHGIAPLPGAAREAKLPAGVIDEQKTAAAAEQALAAAFGPGKWVTSLVEENVYLDLAALDARQISHALAEETAAAALGRVPGIYAAYGRTRILEGRLPHTDVARRVERSFHPKVSGDVVLVSDPFWMPGRGLGTGTTHGTPYAYDTEVPLLLAGAGVRPGRYARRVSTLDLAPTLADLLGILQPAGCEGSVLAEAER
jgi:predicted AlkP superfamily pyrophosphatase or phosphodiesterase